MPTTCVITGYKLGAGAMILYGFILSGNVFEPPNGNYNEFPINFTLPPVIETEDYSQCGYLSKDKQSKLPYMLSVEHLVIAQTPIAVAYVCLVAYPFFVPFFSMMFRYFRPCI